MKNVKQLGLVLFLGAAISLANGKGVNEVERNTSSQETIQETQLGKDCDDNDTNNDISNPVNVGFLDDRTCKYKYKEGTISSNTAKWGIYEIGANTSTDDNLSARMERYFKPRVNPGNDTYEHFKGTFRIESVSDVGKVTSIFQVKGKHIESTGDPAIVLFVAEKVVVSETTYFDIYREQITKRGGKFSNDGRKYVLLTRVKKDENFMVEIKTGFSGSPVNKHYVNAKIKGTWYYFNVPDPQLGLETGIRYGVYGVNSGNAKIYVSNTSFFQKN